MAQTHWVMDYETMINLFVGVFEHYKTDERKIFIIHELRDDTEEFLEFLKQNKKNGEWHISFNGLSFDSQITETILKTAGFKDMSVAVKLNVIYNKAQWIIGNFKEWPEFPEWKLSNQPVDVFKINHWDNAAKRSSLKWIQCAMDWHNVQEMPIPHHQPVHTWKEINEITDYCINDVESTKKALHLSKPLIDVRGMIIDKYGLKCWNYSNTRLGSELLLKMYCDITGRDKREVRKYRTERPAIPIGPILFPYINFKTPELQGFHQLVKATVITNTKNGFKYSLKYRGYEFEFGAGGIHQCITPGAYLEEGDIVIEDIDVMGMYPDMACQNDMYPAHLGPEFIKIYRDEIVNVRKAEKVKPKAERDMGIIEGFKEAANSACGNSNSKYSWLYDPQYNMQTTLNGQLSIMMFVERVLDAIPEVQLLQTNTDGATFRYDKKHKPLFDQICKQWEVESKLTLEYADYKAMYVWDVNNYIGVYPDGKTKCKGRFEWEEFVKYKHTHLHKNKSHLIVAKAVYNYFLNNIMPEAYLASNRNIFDYCGFTKLKKAWKLQQIRIVDGVPEETTLQSTMRYYISNKGGKLIKKNIEDGREIQIEAGKWLTTDYCKAVEKQWEEYDVNESYYLERIYKEIETLIPPPSAQYSLEFDQ